MNRRTAIITGLLAGGIGTSLYSILNWWKFYPPDLLILTTEKDLIAELAEVIIPRTDTPGAKDSGVQYFIIKAVRDCLEPKDQRNFINGIADLKKYTQKNYAKEFIKCNTREKEEIVAYFASSTDSMNSFMKRVRKKIIGDTFFSILKQYTVVGYCTSLPGATIGMNYESVPSRYESCIPLQKLQKSWATK